MLASDLGGINCASLDVSGFHPCVDLNAPATAVWKRSEDLASVHDFTADDDMVSCVSDVDDFRSCMDEEIEDDIRLVAPIGIDTAECCINANRSVQMNIFEQQMGHDIAENEPQEEIVKRTEVEGGAQQISLCDCCTTA